MSSTMELSSCACSQDRLNFKILPFKLSINLQVGSLCIHEFYSHNVNNKGELKYDYIKEVCIVLEYHNIKKGNLEYKKKHYVRYNRDYTFIKIAPVFYINADDEYISCANASTNYVNLSGEKKWYPTISEYNENNESVDIDSDNIGLGNIIPIFSYSDIVSDIVKRTNVSDSILVEEDGEYKYDQKIITKMDIPKWYI